MAKIPRTQAELQEHLSEQIAFLKSSAASFDGGFLGEAKRLAHTIRVLVHDTNQSRSLLGLLAIKSMHFLDTSFPRQAGNLVPQAALVMMGLGGRDGGRYLAMGDGGPSENWVGFDDWWGGWAFDDRTQTLSRGALVLTVANQDGGSHVDPALDEVYARLTRDNSMGWVTVAGSVARPMPEPARASVRQIAHELLRSLDPDHRWKPEYQVGIYAGGMAVFNGPVPPSFSGVGRNDPCPCRSGKKFKKCHGNAKAA